MAAFAKILCAEDDRQNRARRYCPHNCPGDRRRPGRSLQKSLILLKEDWSEWQDLNLRPPHPERGAPPSWTND